MKETLDKCKVQNQQKVMNYYDMEGIEGVDYYKTKLRLMIHIISKTN